MRFAASPPSNTLLYCLVLTVLHEPPSHGHDSAQVGGHAVPTILHGNQCTVLHDTMSTDNEFLHGVQMVILFDLLGFGWTLVYVFTNLTVCPIDKGLITPIPFQTPES